MLNAMEAERKERAFELDEVVVTFAFGNEGQAESGPVDMKEKAFSVEEIGHKDAPVNSTVGEGQQYLFLLTHGVYHIQSHIKNYVCAYHIFLNKFDHIM